MPTNLPPSADGRVFDWLGADAHGNPYYLNPLNLAWSAAGVEHDLTIFRGVAERLGSDTAYWSAIICDANWRYTLVGCVCLLVSRQQGFFDDLRFRFEAGSMVIPQLAVTMALLQPIDARACFELVLKTPELCDHVLRRVSAERALVCLGVREAADVTLEGWSIFDVDNAQLANRVVQEQWEFWRQRV